VNVTESIVVAGILKSSLLKKMEKWRLIPKSLELPNSWVNEKIGEKGKR
jgi:hypothetical protein